jgi:hypothetical protein
LWDTEVVSSVFVAEETERLVLMPLLPSITHDTLTWWPDSKGTFTVKSSYKLAVNTLIETSYLLIPVEMPLIVKNFIWRLLHEESLELCQMQQHYGK